MCTVVTYITRDATMEIRNVRSLSVMLIVFVVACLLHLSALRTLVLLCSPRYEDISQGHCVVINTDLRIIATHELVGYSLKHPFSANAYLVLIITLYFAVVEVLSSIRIIVWARILASFICLCLLYLWMSACVHYSGALISTTVMP